MMATETAEKKPDEVAPAAVDEGNGEEDGTPEARGSVGGQ